jgi:hypothetical protein
VSGSKINYPVILLYAVIASIIALIILYFVYPPVHNALNFVIGKITSAISGAAPKTGVLPWITQNLPWLTMVGSTGVGLLTTYIKLNATNKKLEQTSNDLLTVSTEKIKADNQVTQLSSDLESAKKKITDLEGDTTSDALQRVLGEKDTTIKRLEGALQNQTDMHTNLMDSLFKAGNNTTVYDAIKGETYKVIKLPPETIVK